MAETLKLTPSESLVIKRSTPELLEGESTHGPGGRPPPKHLHPSQDEHFVVLEGSLRARVDGEERDLAEGDILDIPRGTPHQMWNPGEEQARVLWQTRPALRTEQWFRSIDALHREGKVGKNGMPGPLAIGPLLNEFDDVFQLAVGPRPLMKPVVAALAIAGRARGYRPSGGDKV